MATKKWYLLRAKMSIILNFTILALLSTLNLNKAFKTTVEFHLQIEIH